MRWEGRTLELGQVFAAEVGAGVTFLALRDCVRVDRKWLLRHFNNSGVHGVSNREMKADISFALMSGRRGKPPTRIRKPWSCDFWLGHPEFPQPAHNTTSHPSKVSRIIPSVHQESKKEKNRHVPH